MQLGHALYKRCKAEHMLLLQVIDCDQNVSFRSVERLPGRCRIRLMEHFDGSVPLCCGDRMLFIALWISGRISCHSSKEICSSAVTVPVTRSSSLPRHSTTPLDHRQYGKVK